MAYHASQLYSRNVAALLLHLAPEGELALDWDDEITSGACVTRPEGAAAVTDLTFVVELTILVLAAFLGFEVVSKVPTMLHTPLMSGTNFIHGIVIVGAILVLGFADDTFTKTDRLRRDGARDGERGRRLVRDRPHARDVQAAAGAEEGRRRVISDPDVLGLLYLVSIVCFVLALRFLSSPKHARRGNWLGGVGMLVAITTTLLVDGISNWALIVVAAAIGSVVGLVGARKVKMTAMPQMVALFNGVGGGAAALVALAEFHELDGVLAWDEGLSISLSALIGSISFAGSLVAFAKLQELVSGRPIVFPGQNVVNILVLGGAAALGIAIVAGLEAQWAIVALILLALVFGVMFVLPIGGADMPVVISLLNAFTGLAASATGFVLDSTVLIVAGMLVGASGTLLTLLMAKAMNRSIANVLFGAFGQVQAGVGQARADDGRTVRATTRGRRRRPALVRAQGRSSCPATGWRSRRRSTTCASSPTSSRSSGVDVKYAIHPVAGRMPGHMNVLLAEANVPYTQLFEMDEINPEFAQTDVALVIGANDVTNPAARSDPSSPIYGMPILDVDKAASIIVMKRSMNPGFAGIDNELYLDPKTTMLFGDAKESVLKLISAVKAT